MSINTVSISGNITRDSELRRTTSDKAILSFSVAVNERRKNNNGEWEDYANFVDCVIFGKRGDSLAQYLKKGTKVCVNGHLRQSRWERDGQNRSKIDVIVDEIEFFAPKKAQNKPVIDASASIEDEMIPF